MSVIDYDVNQSISRSTKSSRYQGISFDRIYYADDTLLVTTNSRAANNLLHKVEIVSQQYGFSLKRDECSYIAMNGDNVVKFHDGTRLKRVTEATYLGHQITQQMDVKHEVSHKMQQTIITWKKLDMFWKADCCSTKWSWRSMMPSLRISCCTG